jgi:hypothetical protein
MFSFGIFSGVWSLVANILDHFVCSIFIGEWVWRQSVPKSWQLNFILRRISQKKTYDIQNTAKAWNPEKFYPILSCFNNYIAQKHTQKLLYYRLSFYTKCMKHAYNIHFICVIQVPWAVGWRQDLLIYLVKPPLMWISRLLAEATCWRKKERQS